MFAGYSIWLEPEQFQGDLEAAIRTASKELDVIPVPAPHSTVIYGISHLEEAEVKKRFQQLAFKLTEWPRLEHKGFITDIELNGVNGGEMVSKLRETKRNTL